MDKTRFSFTEKEHKLAEIIPNPAIVMYWEQSKEVCPHCKELITKGEHCAFDKIEIWIPTDKDELTCTLSDLVILGISDTRVLMLTKDKILEVLDKTQKFKYLRT